MQICPVGIDHRRFQSGVPQIKEGFMSDYLKGRKSGWRISLPFLACFVMVLALTMPISVPDLLAAETEGWYRLRTNSVPYAPQNVALDSTGGVWVSASDGTEYAPGVWHRPSGAPPGPSFQYITNDQRNNLLAAAYNPPVVKPQLNAAVLYAVRDKGGNTWYALKNRKVLCEKADHSWITIDMPDSSSIQPGVDTTNVDSAHRIRLIDKPDGSQEKLLIAMRGIVRIGADFLVKETRAVYTQWNNDFIKDALVDSQGRYWVTSERGVEKGTSLVNTAYVADLFPSDPNAATGTMITRIVEDSLGNIWFNSYSGDGIYCYSAGGLWTKYADGVVNEIGKNVQDIAAGSDGTVWFGGMYYNTENRATGAILKYVPTGGGQWTRYTQADLGIESGAIPSLVFGGGGLWFTTDYNPAITGNGTGVHYATFNAQGEPSVTHYTYRGNSTTLADLRFSYIAADRSGGVWFPSYDDPSIACLKGDGSWQQFRQTGTGSFGSFGFSGVAVDSRNRVYFAPQNSPPVAYDVTAEQWLALPAPSFGDYYYYGVYIDPRDGKWFHGAYGVYYLNPDNTAWTRYSQSEIPQFPDNYVDGVLADDGGNVWFMCRYGIVLMKKDPAGGAPTWFRFAYNDGTGYTGGYRVYQDDSGQVWNAAKQKFDPQNNLWVTVADTSAFDHRRLRFANGRVPADLDLTGALSPITVLEERNMTLNSRGTILFSGGLGDVTAGIVALGPPAGGTLAVTAHAGGAGTGSVSSNPAGISYHYDTAISGTAGFSQGANVVLTATADAGSTASWNNCTANGGVAGGTTAAATCTFSNLTVAKTVTATFAPGQYQLSLTTSGAGTGTVTSSSGGISCASGSSANCSATFTYNTSVSLYVTPAWHSLFGGWSGNGCSGTGDCEVTMNTSRAINAAFNENLTVKLIGSATALYNTLQEAFTAATVNGTVQAKEFTFFENLSFSHPVTVSFQGGRDASFNPSSGYTTVKGSLQIMEGTLVCDRIVIR
jgi:hypothetical protein